MGADEKSVFGMAGMTWGGRELADTADATPVTNTAPLEPKRRQTVIGT